MGHANGSRRPARSSGVRRRRRGPRAAPRARGSWVVRAADHINTLGPKSAVSKALAADKNKGYYKDVARARKQGESAAEEAKAAANKRRLALLRAPLPLELSAARPLLPLRKREREPERAIVAMSWSDGARSGRA